MDENSEYFFILVSIAVSLSLFFQLLINILLTGKHTNSSRLMRFICLSEGIFIFSEFIIIKKSENYENFFFTFIQRYLLFNWIDFEIKTSFMKTLNIINISFFFSMQTFSLLCNFFICLETIINLVNPISTVKKRVQSYTIVTILASISMAISVGVTEVNCQKIDSDDLFIRLFQPKWAVIVNSSIFLLYLIIGIISFLYLINRFCIRKSLGAKFRNRFVISHFFYYILNFLILTPFYVLSLLWIIKEESQLKNKLKIAIIANLSLGFVMFWIRLSEATSNWRITCRKFLFSSKTEEDLLLNPEQPLTAIINKTLNLEFICCVLNGLTQISKKREKNDSIKQNIEIRQGTTLSLSQVLPESKKMSCISKSNNTKIKVKKNQKKMNDFNKVKKHHIYYNNYFESFNFDQLVMKVKNLRNLDGVSESDHNTTGDFNEYANKKHDAILIEFCPKIFKIIREADDIAEQEFENSFDLKLNLTNIERIKESEGKSGSFFFFTHNNKFLIKTLTNEELRTLLGDFLKQYYEHVTTNPETLLAKIYGVYTVEINQVSKVNVILMQNLNNFPVSHLKRIYDLKGSRIQRDTKNIQSFDKFKTLKDLDYLWMIKADDELVRFEKEHIMKLEFALQSDLSLLRNLNIMDYSLMLIILDFPSENESDYEKIINSFREPRMKFKVYRSRNRKYIYVLGIIDYLQRFTMSKLLENKYKSLLYGNEAKYVSAVDPMFYSRRILSFAKNHIFI